MEKGFNVRLQKVIRERIANGIPRRHDQGAAVKRYETDAAAC